MAYLMFFGWDFFAVDSATYKPVIDILIEREKSLLVCYRAIMQLLAWFLPLSSEEKQQVIQDNIAEVGKTAGQPKYWDPYETTLLQNSR